MKKRIYYKGFVLLITLFIQLTNSKTLIAQCDLFVSSQDFECDDGGTINNPVDDTYTVTINTVNFDNSSIWSETFGPFSVGTNPSVTVTDPANTNCTLLIQISGAPTQCTPPIVCPDFDLCYQLLETTNCTATYLVSIDGNLGGLTNIGQLNFSFLPMVGRLMTFLFSLAVQDIYLAMELQYQIILYLVVME